MDSSKKKISFEAALERLEKIINSLENEDISLDDSMKLFQEGKKLSQYCLKKLTEYEKKIKILIEKENKEFDLKDFPEENDMEEIGEEIEEDVEKDKDEEDLFS